MFTYICLQAQESLYGLKQASRTWYKRFTTYLLEQGFTRRHADRKLFIRTEGET